MNVAYLVAVMQELLRPTARRAAALECVGERYLLLHGGYCGTHQLLNDTWVFDTRANRWLVVDVSGTWVPFATSATSDVLAVSSAVTTVTVHPLMSQGRSCQSAVTWHQWFLSGACSLEKPGCSLVTLAVAGVSDCLPDCFVH